MNMKKSVLFLALANIFCVTIANAQDQIYDTRSLALGGTGAAISNARNAAFLNPSELASDSGKFALDIPIVSVRLLDEKDLLSDVDTLTSRANSLTTALSNFQTTYNTLTASPTTQNLTNAKSAAGTAGTALSNFNSSLNTVNGKTLSGSLFAGAMLAIPSKAFSFALVVDGRAEFGAKFDYASTDNTKITTLSNALTNCGNATIGDYSACTTATGSVGTGGTVSGLSSKLLVRGVVAKEVGIGMARHFDNWGNIDVGLTPKLIQLTTFDVAAGAQSGDGVKVNNGASAEKSESVFNLDLGISKSLKKTETSELKVGFVLKDAIATKTKTVLGNEISFQPRSTIGVGYMTKLTTVGADLDILTNKSMITGMSSDSQFLRLGAEFDAWKWAQIRVGYRHDLLGNYKGLPSVGLGLSPFGLHIDVSVAAADKNEVAGAVQLGFNF
jgi:hypothetical protein